MESRPWVESDAERAKKVGAEIDCSLCKMPALPVGLREYKRTATFSEDKVPAGLLRDHGTKEGVWALIVIETGRLEYTIEEPLQTFLLTPEVPGVIPPVVPHRVKLLGPVRFHVVFLSVPQSPAM
jgi:tellurite methyltransferase